MNDATQAAPDVVVVQPAAPAKPLKTDRSLVKYILLGMITLGIYPLVVMTIATDDVNTIASRYDGKKSMHYCLLTFIIAPITLGIALLVWNHNISNRIGDELKRRNLDYSLSASDFWLWSILGSLILVGPLVYTHKFLTAVNKLSESYNVYG